MGQTVLIIINSALVINENYFSPFVIHNSSEVNLPRNCGIADDRVTDTAMITETIRAFQYIFNHLI